MSPSLLTPCFVDPADGPGAGYGRSVGNDCVPADWIHEPRTLGMHGKDHWIKIWMEDRMSHQPRLLDMPIIRGLALNRFNSGSKKSNGSCWHWSHLAPNPCFVGGWVQDVVEVRIRGAQAVLNP